MSENNTHTRVLCILTIEEKEILKAAAKKNRESLSNFLVKAGLKRANSFEGEQI